MCLEKVKRDHIGVHCTDKKGFNETIDLLKEKGEELIYGKDEDYKGSNYYGILKDKTCLIYNCSQDKWMLVGYDYLKGLGNFIIKASWLLYAENAGGLFLLPNKKQTKDITPQI